MIPIIIEEMTDAQFEEILAEVPEIQYLIILAGKMATKTRVEDVLMIRHNLSRGDAHTFTNLTEYRNKKHFRLSTKGVAWIAGPEPTGDKYPEVEKVLAGSKL